MPGFYDLWERLDEMTLTQLWQSAVETFPDTAMRQHVLGTVVINKLFWIPYKGMKTLFVKGLAFNTVEKTENRPVVVFQKVNYLSEDQVQLMKQNNESMTDVVRLGFQNQQGETEVAYLRKLSEDKTDVLVMCSCNDYRWRMHWWNWKDKVHFGSKPKKYEKKTNKPPVNPGKGAEQPGPGICKHIMKLAVVLRKSGLYL